jgi:F-type H+-transporting ATPase subunit alpha
MMNNYFDDVPVDKVKDFQLKLQDFLVTRKDALLQQLRDKPEINDTSTAGLKEAIAEFKQTYR